MPERFIPSTRTIRTRTLGDLIRPTVIDTEKGLAATFVDGTDTVAIAWDFNNAPARAGSFIWEPTKEEP